VKAGLELLSSIGDALRSEGFKISLVFGAKVPILTFMKTCDDHSFKGDISFSNRLALRNTKLLATYANFDERVAPLGLAIKKWASTFGINNSAAHTFSSYALTIMLIHFLQRVEPPVLSNLQDNDEFQLQDEFVDGEHRVQFANPSEDYRFKFLRNFMSLGELFVGFFEYFGQFNFRDEVVQIRVHDKLWKMDKEWQRSAIAIEDPFDLNHNLTAGVRWAISLFIYKCLNVMQVEFRRPYNAFLQKDFNFESILFKRMIDTLNQNNRTGVSCHQCGKFGHTRNKCPRGQQQPKNAT